MRKLTRITGDSHLRLHTQLLAWLSVGSISLLTIAGCGETQQLATLEGTVSYRGKTLDHGSLRFFGTGGHPISSVIQSDGTYTIQLPAGDFDVSVSSPPTMPANSDPNDDTPPPPDRNALPVRYSQIKKSGLQRTVSLQAEPQTWDIELE